MLITDFIKVYSIELLSMLLEGKEKVKSMFFLSSFFVSLTSYHMQLYFYKTWLRIEQKGLQDGAQKVRV